MDKDPFVSLRRDMGHVLWSGLQLQPEVDIRLRIEPIRSADGLRIIRAVMVRPGITINLDSRREFSIKGLGTDYANLETLEAEMMVVSRHVEGVRASIRERNCIELVMQLPEQPQSFWLAAGIEGRWDWFVDPREMLDMTALMSASRRVSELLRPTA